MDYIKPELLILIPVLIGIGKAAKTAGLKPNFIPLALILAGVGLAILWTFAEGETTAQAVFTGVVQGVLAALAATGAHQNAKQIKDCIEEGKDHE